MALRYMLKGAQPMPLAAAVRLRNVALGPVATQPLLSRLNSASAKPPLVEGRPITNAVFPSVEEAPTSQALPAGITLTFKVANGAAPVVENDAAAVEFARNNTKLPEGCVVTAAKHDKKNKSLISSGAP
jgi:hypothetical protein